MPRMAFDQTHRAHRAATQNTVNANGVSGVFGAAREEAAARPQHRANAVLVRFDQAERGNFADVAFAECHAITEDAGRGGCVAGAATAVDFAM